MGPVGMVSTLQHSTRSHPAHLAETSCSPGAFSRRAPNPQAPLALRRKQGRAPSSFLVLSCLWHPGCSCHGRPGSPHCVLPSWLGLVLLGMEMVLGKARALFSCLSPAAVLQRLARPWQRQGQGPLLALEEITCQTLPKFRPEEPHFIAGQ